MAPAPGWGWRLLAGTVVCVLSGPGLCALVFQRGSAAVLRFEWASDGTWSIADGTGRQGTASLAPQTAAIGPWILLVFASEGSGTHRYALIDARQVSPEVFRALRGRLKLAFRHPRSGGTP